MKHLLPIVLLISLSTTANGHYLDSLDDFQLEFANNWSFQCVVESIDRQSFSNQQLSEGATNSFANNSFTASNTEIADRYRLNSIKGVYKGLKALAQINPNLLAHIEESQKGKVRDWNCDPSMNNRSYAHVENENIVFDSSSIIDLINEDEYISQLAAFHEFLHISNADNLEVAEHNQSQEDLISNPMTSPHLVTDVIYACTAQVYPAYILEYRPTGNYYTNSKALCEVCSRARIRTDKTGTEVSSNPEDVVFANKACKDVKDKSYIPKPNI